MTVVVVGELSGKMEALWLLMKQYIGKMIFFPILRLKCFIFSTMLLYLNNEFSTKFLSHVREISVSYLSKRATIASFHTKSIIGSRQ